VTANWLRVEARKLSGISPCDDMRVLGPEPAASGDRSLSSTLDCRQQRQRRKRREQQRAELSCW
jgi:hypothetical protein